MNPSMALRWALTVLALAGTAAAHAGRLELGAWYQFNQNGRDAAQGCPPEDEFAPECFGSSGTPTLLASKAAWYVETSVPVWLTVADAFISGDRFDVYDGLLLDGYQGTTRAPALGAFVDCGDDPVVCLASDAHSQGRFLLQPDAARMVLFTLRESADDALPFGSAYFRLDAATVALPSTLPLVLLAGALGWRRARSAGSGGLRDWARKGA